MIDFIKILLLIVCGVSAGLCDESSERFTFDRSASKISKYLTTENYVYHMERDQYAAGNILISDGNSLKTTDGQTTQTIAGDSFYRGYAEGVGGAARFWSITGFAQISRNRVVVIDWGNRCLRLIDRLTKQTQVFSGKCTVMGNKDGAQALFNRPWSVIIDNQNKGKLLVTDSEYKAVKHVDIKTGHATTIFREEKLDLLFGMTQEVGTGDLYLTSRSAVYKLRYRNKALSHVAGTSMLKGHMDKSFSASQFNAPVELLLIDRGTKLIIADDSNHRLRVLDRKRNTTQSLCIGTEGHKAGDMDSCSLYHPFSLMVSGDTLFIGDYKQISKLVGSVQTSTVPAANTITTRPTTTAPTTKYTTTPTTTTNYPIAPSLCAHGNITKQLQPGEKMVEVEIEQGLNMSFPAGEYHFKIATKHESCMIHLSVTEAMPNSKFQCPSDINVSASPMLGLGDIELVCGETVHKLSLPVGDYTYQTFHRGDNCTSLVRISDYSLVRRMKISAEYDVACNLVSDPVTMSTLDLMANNYIYQIEKLICEKDCEPLAGSKPVVSCTNDTLSLIWSTAHEYSGSTTNIPPDLLRKLEQRLDKFSGQLRLFHLVLMNHTPPVVQPKKWDIFLSPFCLNNRTYVKKTGTCQ